MRIVKTFLVLGVSALAMWSCNNATKSDGAKDGLTIQPLTNNPTAEKQYLFFRLTEPQETDSSMVYLAKSVFNADTVAIKIEVRKGITPGVTNDNVPLDIGFSEGSITMHSVGTPSDKFVAALGSMFGLETNGTMAEVVAPTVFSSNKVEVEFSNVSTYSFKLFFANELGEPAEVFAVLDLYRRAFEIEEKDPAQRAQLLSAFENELMRTR